MHPLNPSTFGENISNNFSHLNFLLSLNDQFKAQFVLRGPSQLQQFPSEGLFPLLPNFNYHPQLPVTAILNMLESSNKDNFLYRIHHQALQTELMKAQIIKLTQEQSPNTNPGIMPKILQEKTNEIVKPQNLHERLACPASWSQPTLENQVRQIIDFILKNVGYINQNAIEMERNKYKNDEILDQVFTNLMLKYTSTTKTKEEMIKYVFRKALKSLRDKLKGENKKSDKEISRLFYQKYFNDSKEAMLVQKNKKDDPEVPLDFLLPFKKNSSNKTMNSKFFSKIFASKTFCTDYAKYISEFEIEADYDNNKKIAKFVAFIVICIKNNRVPHILTEKRVPWLKIWVQNAYKIGQQLMHENSSLKAQKKIKLDLNESSESDCKIETSSTHESS